ncbi:MAG: glycine cleavage system protein GcvH [Bacteroidota bacterium]
MSKIPGDCRYTSDHEWIRVNEDGVAVIGITDFAQQELSDIVYVEVETVGENLASGEVFGIVEAVKTTSDLFMPISGEVLEFNGALEDSPETINEDPYGDGWIAKVKPSDPDEIEGLLSAEAYEAEIS